jgi:uncharacterized membrane protein
MQIDISSIIVCWALIFACIGFLIASHIYQKKKSKKKLICPLRTNCDLVVNSSYSHIGPFSVEVLGMSYYSVTLFLYSFASLFLNWNLFYKEALFVLAGVSVAFSFYLLFLQGFVIKQWCVWCISSALISLMIFLLSYLHLFI